MASKKLAITWSWIILRKEINMYHSTNMNPAQYTSGVELSWVPYRDYFNSFCILMTSSMFYLAFTYLFVDSTNAFVTGKNLPNYFSKINCELINLAE